MRLLSVLLMLLAGAVALQAQPWQWQAFQGDYYNPTGFPPSFAWPHPAVMGFTGDFDGDGRAEFLGDQNQIASLDADTARLHWTVRNPNLPSWNTPLGVLHDAAVDRDGLVTLQDDTLRVWLGTLAPAGWSWTEHPELATGLFAPAGVLRALYGDYDGNGVLNGIFIVGDGNETYVHYERSENGTWSPADGICDDYPWGCLGLGLFDGDFDGDGDLDFGWLAQIPDGDPVGILQENTGSGWIVHDWLWIVNGPAAADFDGDGMGEALIMDHTFGQLVYAELVPDPDYWLATGTTHALGRLTGPIVGAVQTPEGRVMLAARNGWEWYANLIRTVSRAEVRTPQGWQSRSGHFATLAHVTSASLGDLDGDGLREALVVGAHGYYYSTTPFWYFLENRGTVESDTLSGSIIWHRFVSRTDTVFSSPQLADADGNGRAELFMVATPPAGLAVVQAYELMGEVRDTVFVARPDLVAGLPHGITQLAAGNLNADAQDELIARSGAWHAYFFWGGSWHEQSVNLPAGSSAWLTLADADNDGDDDLFTPATLHYNLTPAGAEEWPGLRPEEISLAAFPNPFNAQTQVRFTLPRAGRVTLALYDVLGRRVLTLKDEVLAAGAHTAHVDGFGLASGLYFVRLETAERMMTAKLALIK